MINKDKCSTLCLLRVFADDGFAATLAAPLSAPLDKVAYPGFRGVSPLWRCKAASGGKLKLLKYQKVFHNDLVLNRWSVRAEKRDLLECVWSCEVTAWPRWSSSADTEALAHCWLSSLRQPLFIFSFFSPLFFWHITASPKNAPCIFKEGETPSETVTGFKSYESCCPIII